MIQGYKSVPRMQKKNCDYDTKDVIKDYKKNILYKTSYVLGKYINPKCS